MTQRHVLSVTVRDQPGVLVRIASLFARRGFNIESLSVAQSEEAGLSRTTFVVNGDDPTIEQVQTRVEIRQIAQDFRARIVDVSRSALIFEVTGDEGKMDAFIEQMRPFGIQELIRTGRVALTRTATN